MSEQSSQEKDYTLTAMSVITIIAVIVIIYLLVR